VTEDAKNAADRFPEGEPSVKNVMIALQRAQEDAMARAEAVRQREEAARREEEASSTEED